MDHVRLEKGIPDDGESLLGNEFHQVVTLQIDQAVTPTQMDPAHIDPMKQINKRHLNPRLAPRALPPMTIPEDGNAATGPPTSSPSWRACRPSSPVIAIADLHGQLEQLKQLIAKLEMISEWDECALVFLGDYVDRGEDVPGTIDLVLKLLSRRPGGSAALGNHDLALVRATRLDDGPPSPYWIESYLHRYDHQQTFLGYFGRRPNHGGRQWENYLKVLKKEIPAEHKSFLSSLPWVVESPGHLFLHCGLSPELEASPLEQVAALHRKEWNRSTLKPVAGTNTDLLWQPEYPVWIGADKNLSKTPLEFPGKVQVTGHVQVCQPEVNAARIRLDTSGGFGYLTACLLRSAVGEPEFISSEP